MELIQDGQEGETVEPLMAVSPNIKAARGEALRHLTDVENGGQHQPEAVTVEIDRHGAG